MTQDIWSTCLGLLTKKRYSVFTRLALAIKDDYDNTREINKIDKGQMNVFNSMSSSRPVDKRETACNKTGDSFVGVDAGIASEGHSNPTCR